MLKISRVNLNRGKQVSSSGCSFLLEKITTGSIQEQDLLFLALDKVDSKLLIYVCPNVVP